MNPDARARLLAAARAACPANPIGEAFFDILVGDLLAFGTAEADLEREVVKSERARARRLERRRP